MGVYVKVLKSKEKIEKKQDYVKVEIRLPLYRGASPSSGCFPDYTLAEIIYVSLYERDPENAHEKIYELLEPILLSDTLDRFAKKAFFIPVKNGLIWRRLQERLVEVLSHVNDNVREKLCSYISDNIHLLFYSLPYKRVSKDHVLVEVDLNTKLLSLCPQLNKLRAMGVRK